MIRRIQNVRLTLNRSLSRFLEEEARTRQGFGSFHSDDIEEMVMDPNFNLPPSLLETEKRIELDWCEHLKHLKLGRGYKGSAFVQNSDWTFLNHGAFGGALLPMLQLSECWRRECESQPLLFFDRNLFPLMARSIRQIARFFNCPADELYPLQNVTSGLNCVLNSIQLTSGDEVICFSLTYGSTKKMLTDLCARTGATLRIVHIPLPITSAKCILSSLSNTINENTKLVIIDQITSNTAFLMPTLELASIAKQAGALVVVDAAHAMMSTHVQIYPENIAKTAIPSTLQGEYGNTRSDKCISDVVDIWLTNAHKWFCAPKGSAFMWVRPSVAPQLRPAVISHGFSPPSYKPSKPSVSSSSSRNNNHPNVKWWHERSSGASSQVVNASEQGIMKSKLLSALAWDGCRDYTSLLCIPLGLRLWGEIGNIGNIGNIDGKQQGFSDVAATHEGMNVCRAYMIELLHDQAIPLLMEEWNLKEVDFPAPLDMRISSPMALVCMICSI